MRTKTKRSIPPAMADLAVWLGPALALALALAAGPAAAQTERTKAEIELKIATLAPEGMTAVNILHEMDDEVRKKTGDKVGLKLYPGGQMGEERTVLSKVRMGQLHGGAFSGMGLGEIMPAVRALEIPFFFKTYEECDAGTEAVKDRITALFEKEGWVELGRAEQGFIYLLAANRISTVDDLKKSKLVMITGDPLAQLVVDVVGLKPIPQNVTDVLTSLATGAINAVYISPAYAIALQWNTKTKYLVDFPLLNGTGFIVVSKKAFDKVPADLQPTVLEITRRHSARLIPLTREEGDEAMDLMKKQGIKIAEMSDEQKTDFERVGIEVREKLPAVVYPSDAQKQGEMRGLIAEVVKAVEEKRAGKAPGAVATKPPAKGE